MDENDSISSARRRLVQRELQWRLLMAASCSAMVAASVVLGEWLWYIPLALFLTILAYAGAYCVVQQQQKPDKAAVYRGIEGCLGGLVAALWIPCCMRIDVLPYDLCQFPRWDSCDLPMIIYLTMWITTLCWGEWCLAYIWDDHAPDDMDEREDAMDTTKKVLEWNCCDNSFDTKVQWKNRVRLVCSAVVVILRWTRDAVEMWKDGSASSALLDLVVFAGMGLACILWVVYYVSGDNQWPWIIVTTWAAVTTVLTAFCWESTLDFNANITPNEWTLIWPTWVCFYFVTTINLRARWQIIPVTKRQRSQRSMNIVVLWVWHSICAILVLAGLCRPGMSDGLLLIELGEPRFNAAAIVAFLNLTLGCFLCWHHYKHGHGPFGESKMLLVMAIFWFLALYKDPFGQGIFNLYPAAFFCQWGAVMIVYRQGLYKFAIPLMLYYRTLDLSWLGWSISGVAAGVASLVLWLNDEYWYSSRSLGPILFLTGILAALVGLVGLHVLRQCPPRRLSHWRWGLVVQSVTSMSILLKTGSVTDTCFDAPFDRLEWPLFYLTWFLNCALALYGVAFMVSHHKVSGDSFRTVKKVPNGIEGPLIVPLFEIGIG